MGGPAGGVGALVLLSFVLLAVAPTSLALDPAESPSLSLSATPLDGRAPLSVDFSASLTPSTIFAGFNWTFGDGHSLEGAGMSGSYPVHVYATPGSYLVEVMASTSSGVLESNLVVRVGPAPFVAEIGTTPTVRGTAPLTVEFEATLYGGTGTYASILWNFGNGQFGSGLDLNYTYDRPGDFVASLTVVDSAGATASANETVDFAGPAGPAAPFLALPVPLVIVALLAGVLALGVYVLERPRPYRAAGAPGAVPFGAEMEYRDDDPGADGPVAARGDASTLPNVEAQESYERILVALYHAGRPSVAAAGRSESTREGLARELHVAPSTVGRALRRLRDAGAVSASLDHVPGAPRRVYCYSLTPSGESADARSSADPATPGPRRVVQVTARGRRFPRGDEPACRRRRGVERSYGRPRFKRAVRATPLRCPGGSSSPQR